MVKITKNNINLLQRIGILLIILLIVIFVVYYFKDNDAYLINLDTLF